MGALGLTRGGRDARQIFGVIVPCCVCQPQCLNGLFIEIDYLLLSSPLLTVTLPVQLPADPAVTLRSSWLSARVILVSCCLPNPLSSQNRPLLTPAASPSSKCGLRVLGTWGALRSSGVSAQLAPPQGAQSDTATMVEGQGFGCI